MVNVIFNKAKEPTHGLFIITVFMALENDLIGRTRKCESAKLESRKLGVPSYHGR